MGKDVDYIDAEIVEVNDQPLKVEVTPVGVPLPTSAQALERSTKQQLARVPAVTDLPNWEDG